MQFLVLAKPGAEAFKNGPPADFAQVAARRYSAHAQKAYMSGALRAWMRDAGSGPAAIVEAASEADVRALFADWPLLKVGHRNRRFALHPYHGFGGG